MIRITNPNPSLPLKKDSRIKFFESRIPSVQDFEGGNRMEGAEFPPVRHVNQEKHKIDKFWRLYSQKMKIFMVQTKVIRDSNNFFFFFGFESRIPVLTKNVISILPSPERCTCICISLYIYYANVRQLAPRSLLARLWGAVTLRGNGSVIRG